MRSQCLIWCQCIRSTEPIWCSPGRDRNHTRHPSHQSLDSAKRGCWYASAVQSDHFCNRHGKFHFHCIATWWPFHFRQSCQYAEAGGCGLTSQSLTRWLRSCARAQLQLQGTGPEIFNHFVYCRLAQAHYICAACCECSIPASWAPERHWCLWNLCSSYALLEWGWAIVHQVKCKWPCIQGSSRSRPLFLPQSSRSVFPRLHSPHSPSHRPAPLRHHCHKWTWLYLWHGLGLDGSFCSITWCRLWSILCGAASMFGSELQHSAHGFSLKYIKYRYFPTILLCLLWPESQPRSPPALKLLMFSQTSQLSCYGSKCSTLQSWSLQNVTCPPTHYTSLSTLWRHSSIFQLPVSIILTL